MSFVTSSHTTHTPSESGTSTVFSPAVPSIIWVPEFGNGSVTSYSSRYTNPDKIPGYRDLIRRGLPASSQLDASRVRLRCNNGIILMSSVHTLNPNLLSQSGIRGSGFLLSDLTTPSFDDEPSRIKALQRFLSAYQQNISQFKGGVFFGEIKETISLITHPGRLVRTAVDDYLSVAKKARRSITGRQLTRTLSRLWLEFTFGIKPLLQDIEDASHALADISANRRLQTRIQGTSTHRYTVVDQVYPSTVNVAGLAIDIMEETSVQIDYRYYGNMWLDTGSPTQIINSLGFAPSDWLPTVWELIPYSFVIDYFANIGDLINAWSFGTSQLNWSNLTKRQKRISRRYTSNIRNTDPSFNATFDVSNPPESVVTATHIERAVNPSLVMPLTFRIPGIGSTRWINLSALVLQQGKDKNQRL